MSAERDLARAITNAHAAAYQHGFAVAADNGTEVAKERAAEDAWAVLREAWRREFGSDLQRDSSRLGDHS